MGGPFSRSRFHHWFATPPLLVREAGVHPTLDTRNPRTVTPLDNCPVSTSAPQSRLLSPQATRVSKIVTMTTTPVKLWSSVERHAETGVLCRAETRT